MKTNKLTTIFGILAALPLLLHQFGVSLGHFGSGDIFSAIGAVATGLLGASAKDHNQ